MRREKWEQQHPLRISFCFFNSLPALPQPHPLIFPSQFAFMSRALPPCIHITLHLFLQCFTSTTPPSAAPSIPSSLPFLLPLPSLRPLSSLAVSLFFCPSISPPFWTFDRSFRNHILKRILDIRNPHRTLTVCGWTSASLFSLMCFVLTAFFIAATDGPFLPGVRVRTMRIGMRFLAAPYWPDDTPCQHSSISTSVAHLWCSVVRLRHPGTGYVTSPLSRQAPSRV